MDSDGDGTVTQSELESYIVQQGGTQTEADNLYSMLAQSDSNGITEDDLASQAPPPPPPGGPGGPGGGPPPQNSDGSSDATSDLGSKLVSLFDTNGDGTVSQSELENFVTQNGGTTDTADTYFTSLDTTGSGSLSSSDFATAIEKLQENISNNYTSPILTLLDAFANNTSTTTSSLSVTA